MSDHLLAEVERVLIEHKHLSAHVPDKVTPPATVTPDEFYARLLHAGFEDDVLETVHRISIELNNPPRSPSELLDGLEHIGPTKTVAHLRNDSGTAKPEE